MNWLSFDINVIVSIYSITVTMASVMVTPALIPLLFFRWIFKCLILKIVLGGNILSLGSLLHIPRIILYSKFP